MHSGADVEAFQAALNRDIEGDASNSQLSDSNSGIFISSFFFFFGIWQPICKTKKLDFVSKIVNLEWNSVTLFI